jgi:enterochelin esterase-like enzyme
MRRITQFSIAILSVFWLAIYPIAAQTNLPTMPTGGPDNGTYDKSGRFPAGTVSTVNFYSSVAGKNVDMLVYTPPGYSTSQKYGVIFCYQGITDKATNIFNGSWVMAGIISDNLIGEGKISKGVIIVAVDDQFNGDYSNVQDMTIRDAIPYIDSHYSTYADANHRGIFGYSWGGGYTFNVGAKNLDYFRYLSPSSAAPNKESDNVLFPSGGAYAKQVMKCLFISWGQYDYQSIIDANVATVNYCTNNGIPKFSWVAQGQGHSGGTWRPAMWNFLQLADRAGISSSTCTPTTITPSVQVNGGTWQSVNTVTVNAGTSVKLGPQPVTGGSWSWTGCGTSGTAREQTIAPTSTCTATATYTNTCGAKSTMNFTINITGTTGCGTAPNGFPYCCSNSDPDGDGWGWENNGSCVIKPTTTQLPNGTYTITARHSGKVLDVYNSSMVDGGNVDQWTYVAGAANQKWIVESLGSGTYSIKALHSGKSLDVSGNSLVDGGDINQWTYNASANQKWKIESVGSGYHRIVSVSSGKCVDVVGNSTTDGASINQYTCSGANNQSFTFQSTTARLASEEQEVEQVTTGIYPNPSNGLFNVSYAGSFSYIIKNSIGAEIEKGVGNGKAIVGKNISTPGIYILQITSSKGSEKIRLVKN